MIDRSEHVLSFLPVEPLTDYFTTLRGSGTYEPSRKLIGTCSCGEWTEDTFVVGALSAFDVQRLQQKHELHLDGSP